MSEVWRHILTFDGQSTTLAESEVVAGRSQSCDVCILEASVSRRHARIVAAGDALIVEDLGSSNGTFVNDEPITGRTTVRNGDRLGLGDAEIDVEIVRESEPEPASPPERQYGDATMFLVQESRALAQHVEKIIPPVPEPEIDVPEIAEPEAAVSENPVPEIDAPDVLYGTIAIKLPDADRLATQVEARVDAQSPSSVQRPEPAIDPPIPAPPEPVDPPKPPAPDERPSAAPNVVPNQDLWSEDEAFARVETPPLPISPSTRAAPEAVTPNRILPMAPLMPRLMAWTMDLASWVLGGGLLWIVLGLNEQPRGWWTAAVAATVIGLGTMVLGWGLWGTTPGKRLFGLYVCTREGQVGIGIPRAGLRALGWLLSVATLGLGFALALGASRQTLHDRIAGTFVGTSA